MSDSFQQLTKAYLEAETAHAKNTFAEDVTHFVPGVVSGLTCALGIFGRAYIHHWLGAPVLVFGICFAMAAFIAMVLAYLRSERSRYEMERLIRMTTSKEVAEKTVWLEQYAVRVRRFRLLVGTGTMLVYAALQLIVLAWRP